MTLLKEKILRLIREQGPITLAHYMQMALLDPDHGYYMKRDPLGRDFITAPEVSQIFGELIALFFIQAWEDRGRPRRFHWVELGPGRGTLIADMLRTAKIRPAFGDAGYVTLIETSPALRAIQMQNLGDRVTWAQSLDEIPGDAPLFAVGNEFLDALPIRQFVMARGGWHEKMVMACGGALQFALAPTASHMDFLPKAAQANAVFEISPAARSIVAELANRIAKRDGVALIIDYGHAKAGFGDTFQAVKAHGYADPLVEPGESDLTAHVDFSALADAARQEHAQVLGPATQADFLEALGIRLRAERLTRAGPQTANEIEAAIDRLTGKDQMGTLFKVLALAAPNTPRLPGFSC